jgi:hypothetical protein
MGKNTLLPPIFGGKIYVVLPFSPLSKYSSVPYTLE